MKQTKLICGNCGAEVILPQESTFVSGMCIAKNSGLGTIVLPTEKTMARMSVGQRKALSALVKGENIMQATRSLSMEELQDLVGIMTQSMVEKAGDNKETVEKLSKKIEESGTILSHHLYKQHVTSQMFRMLTREHNWWNKVDDPIRYDHFTENMKRSGYEYTWEVLVNKLHEQAKMFENNDMKCFEYDNLWFNKNLAVDMIIHYKSLLHRYINELRVLKWKKKDYIPLRTTSGLFGGHIRDNKGYNLNKGLLLCDIDNMFMLIDEHIENVRTASNPRKLYESVRRFVDVKPSLHFKFSDLDRASETYKKCLSVNEFNHNCHDWRLMKKWPSFEEQCPEWQNAYKGYGAYYTMQDLIMFPTPGHDACRFGIMNEAQSMRHLNKLAKQFAADGEGYKLLGVLKEFLVNNHVDIVKMQNDWKESYKNK